MKPLSLSAVPLKVSLIVAVALVLRVVWALLVPVDPISDSSLYDAFARSLAAGKGYAYADGNLTAYWPVGTSAVYAALYQLFGLHYAPIAVFNVLIGTAIVWLTHQLALRHFDERVAAVAGWLVALWPILIQFTTVMASELLFIFLILSALWVWTSPRLGSLVRAVLWGALVCAATYVRPTAWPLLVIFALLACWLTKKPLAALAAGAVSVLVAAILFSPWVYRNHQLYGKFVLVATNGGPNLWMGNNAESTGGYMPLPTLDFKDEVERDTYYGGLAKQYISAHKLDYLRLSARRAVLTYDRESIGVAWNEKALTERFGAQVLMPLKGLTSAYWWLLLLSGAIGVGLLVKQGRFARALPLLTMFAFFAAIPILTVGQDRYHLPINPFLAIFAAYAVVCGWGAPDKSMRQVPHAN